MHPPVYGLLSGELLAESGLFQAALKHMVLDSCLLWSFSQGLAHCWGTLPPAKDCSSDVNSLPSVVTTGHGCLLHTQSLSSLNKETIYTNFDVDIYLWFIFV